ncbi:MULTISPECIES: Rv3654c family TadE-like protein [Micrococcaceae]|uniref:Rv3654c family TadE-like protein n=1 Tax=unclassified Kocuria TaxID=2649579 RepID=UPI001EE0D076|nr:MULTISPECIES: Rv3654c family TadE-like protein [unclassified Kocuria]
MSVIRFDVRQVRDCDDDQGSAAVMGIVVVMMVISLLMLVSGVSHVALMNHRAAKSADLAALAAADAARGITPGEPCDIARSLGADNGARLVHCALAPERSDVVDVEVEVSLHPMLAVLGPARGISRAGPPPSEEEEAASSSEEIGGRLSEHAPEQGNGA